MEEQNKYCPNSNLVWAILCTFLCCLPLGIVAIIKATSVERFWVLGFHQEAQKAANDAKKYSIWGAAVGVIFVALYFLFNIMIFALV